MQALLEVNVIITKAWWEGFDGLFTRVDVVICLSTTVRNDTLQEVKDQRVSMKCRKQLRVEELEMVSAYLNMSNIL